MRFEEDEDEDLDERFLSRWSPSRSTISDEEEEFTPKEEDEEGDLWSSVINDRKSIEEQQNNIARLIHEASLKRNAMISITSLQEESARQKEARREYQRRYRNGEIVPGHATEIKRAKSQDAFRKRLTYKLTAPLQAKLRQLIQDESTGRRKILIKACTQFLSCKSEDHKITAANEDRTFMYDEIPSELWDRIDAYCRNDKERRTMRHFQFVELALNAYLKSKNQ